MTIRDLLHRCTHFQWVLKCSDSHKENIFPFWVLRNGTSYSFCMVFCSFCFLAQIRCIDLVDLGSKPIKLTVLTSSPSDPSCCCLKQSSFILDDIFSQMDFCWIKSQYLCWNSQIYAEELQNHFIFWIYTYRWGGESIVLYLYLNIIFCFI